MSASVEAFAGAGKELGVEIWKVVKFNPVKQPAGKSGRFSKGDCYIVLHTFKRGSSKVHSIHFWLGSKASQDESGSAAILATTLDKQLGGVAVQFREIEASESEEFLQLFPEGVLYLSGGVASGFTKVEGVKYETRLLHVHGLHRARIAEVPVEVSSLNSGDCFVLDDGLAIYQWNGSTANLAEKSKVLDISIALRNDRNGVPKVSVLEEGDITSENAVKFYAKLGVDDLSSLEIAPSALKETKTLFSAPALYKACEGKFTEVATDKMKRDMLDTNGMFIVYAGGALYIWQGRGLPEEDKKAIWTTATRFLIWKDLPVDMRTQVVKQGLEPPLFEQQFFQWQAETHKEKLVEAKTAHSKGETEIDIQAMVAGKTGQVVKDTLPDVSSSGKAKVWRVVDNELEEVPEDQYGDFLAGDSYVLKYSYAAKQGADQHMIYYWQGQDSSVQEKAASAAQAVKLDDELGGSAVQVRVVQNNEPTHFLHLFPEGMIVQLGGHGSKPEGREGPTGAALYQVKATSPQGIRAVQLTTSALSLNSGDVFVLVEKSKVVVWEGSMSTKEEKEFASKIAKRLADSKDVQTIGEGEEDDAFWEVLGGKQEYPKVGDLGPPECPPRLFQVSDATTGGSGVDVEEIFHFSQADLDERDVMMLDTFREIFLWVGKDSRQQEKKGAFDLAQKYLEEVSKVNGRSCDVPITYVSSGQEPPIFKCHFVGWDDTKEPAFVDPYDSKLKNFEEEQANSTATELLKVAQERTKAFVDPLAKKEESQEAAATPAVTLTPVQPAEFKYKPLKDVFPYEKLKTMTAVDGIDPAHKEDYLSEEEFKEIFKKTRKEYKDQPAWRQVQNKKECGLF
ncbi:unnamed protein product [Ostreobium quekettii]|uniref:HP domain-containing protein n=1 Tax=Ostreobium quekettii TaxID=121088 RepID=A0A8S1JC58_9CHLO|nr:unnamed protein product [Ostreobium quekettii]